MVVPSLAIGGGIGVLLSGGFIWWEVGRFATPQVPVTVFDERKLLAGYTVGLFVGVPISVLYLLFVYSLSNSALLGALVFLVALAGVSELAQSLVLRAAYWKGPPGPFYALALRAGIGGILALTIVTTYLGSATISLLEAAPTAVAAIAVVALEVTGALVSLAPPQRSGRPSGRPIAGLLFGVAGFFLVGFGPLAGPAGAVGGAAVAALGAALVYRRRRPMLGDVPPPGSEIPPPRSAAAASYGRTEPAPVGDDAPLR